MTAVTVANKTPPENKDRELTPILDELSHDPDIKLDQLKSLTLVCLAFEMIPGHIVESSIKCLYKRRQRIKLVSTVQLHMLEYLK